MRRRGHIFYTISSQMAARLSALRAGRRLPPGRFRAIVRLEGLGRLKNSVTSSGFERKTFRLVVWCHNQLRYSVPPLLKYYDFFYLRGGALGTAGTTGLFFQPRMIGDGDCGEIGGMKIGSGNRSTRRKPAPAPLCPPQIPHDYTRAAAVGSQRLTV
jgi:hypothetical protein